MHAHGPWRPAGCARCAAPRSARALVSLRAGAVPLAVRVMHAFRATGYPTCSPASTARREETTPRPSEHALTCDPSERPCCNTPSGQHRTPLPDIKAHVHAGPRSAVGEEDLGLMAPHGVVSAVRTVLAGATLEGMRPIAPRAGLAYNWQPNQFRNCPACSPGSRARSWRLLRLGVVQDTPSALAPKIPADGASAGIVWGNSASCAVPHDTYG